MKRLRWDLDRRFTTTFATLVLVALVSAASIAVWYGLRDPVNPIRLSDAVFTLTFLGFPVVGWVLATKLPENPQGWIFLSFSALVAIGVGAGELATYAGRGGSTDSAAVLSIFGAGVFYIGIMLLIGPGILLFPEGRLFSPGWRWALWVPMLILATLWALLVLAVSPICIDRDPTSGACNLQAANPLALNNYISEAVLELAVGGLLLLTAVVSIASLVVRYRGSSRDRRYQMRWVVWITAVALLALIVVSAAQEVTVVLQNEWVGVLVFATVTVGIPIAIGISILRYRLFDIDRLISRTFSYGLLSGALVFVYFCSVAILQRIAPAESPLAIIISTLVIAGLFSPLRRRIQEFIDKRFHRRAYDAQKMLTEFSATIRDEVDMDRISQRMLQVVEESLHPEHASLWLLETGKRRSNEIPRSVSPQG